MNPDQTNQPQSEQTPLCRAITLLEQSAAPFDEACRILRELASGEAGMLVKLVPVRTLQDSINEWDELIASTDINAPVPAKQEEAPAPALQTVLHWFVFCEQNGIKVDMKTRAGQIPSNTILTEAQFCIEACLRYPLRAAHDQACTVPATEEAPAPGHNPDRLTIAQVGKGWRLLEEDEVDVFSRYNSPLDEIECRSLQHDCWGPGYNGANKSLSYRTRLSRAELRAARGLPPEPQLVSTRPDNEQTRAEDHQSDMEQAEMVAEEPVAEPEDREWADDWVDEIFRGESGPNRNRVRIALRAALSRGRAQVAELVRDKERVLESLKEMRACVRNAVPGSITLEFAEEIDQADAILDAATSKPQP